VDNLSRFFGIDGYWWIFSGGGNACGANFQPTTIPALGKERDSPETYFYNISTLFPLYFYNISTLFLLYFNIKYPIPKKREKLSKKIKYQLISFKFNIPPSSPHKSTFYPQNRD